MWFKFLYELPNDDDSLRAETCSNVKCYLLHWVVFDWRVLLLFYVNIVAKRDVSEWGLFVCTTTHCSLKAYCAILVRPSNFSYQASSRVSPRESTQRRKVELWARMSGNFAEMTTFTPFRDLLHAVNLRHGTEGFTSPPNEGVLRIFSP